MPSEHRSPSSGVARSRRRRVGAGVAAGVALASLTLLVGCAPEPDPAATRDALTEVTSEPVAPDVVDEYSASEHPDPIVEPLDCTPYLIVTARGTGEPSRKQLLGPVARAIEEARPDETLRLDLDYPADTEINAGATLGARTLIDTLNVQAKACPEQRTILLGYSQGALVIGDALAAPDARLVGATVGEVTEAAADRVLAIVLYGNPRFVGADPTGYGSFSPDVNGLLPRPPGSFSQYEGRMRDYCVDDDFICQSTLSVEEAGHVAYYDNGMQADGAAYVITRLGPIPKADAEKRGDEENRGDAPGEPRERAAADGEA
ncbi:cutinase family protein [Leucobacter aridicollis]|uniref:cutinase family protein n=1 Tax=Leucobacter aridicollis TaxID=283878 RepID=UPI000E648CB5|nr:cutinase family protein [Leucobacter aridicollis]UTX54530.1 cutinase family protein [Leucobacter aridicollis]